MERIKIGLIGYGTVGSSLYQLIARNGDSFKKRLGVDVQVARIGVKDKTRKREGAPDNIFCQGFNDILEDPEISIIIELIGGVEIPYKLIRQALSKGKQVITANKALLAEHGEELFKLAKENGVRLKFEAAVGGGIPIIKVIRESLMGNRITRISGIVNGTTNYILTRMTEGEITFQEALKEAQEAGFAEKDPAMDVEGVDAAQKISLLASISFGFWIDYHRILVEGITHITPEEIAFARFSGFVFKLIAEAKLVDNQPAVTVFPALIGRDHPLASVRDVYNAVLLESDFLGSSIYQGRGAGGQATASSVASDLGDLLKGIVVKWRTDSFPSNPFIRTDLFPVKELVYRYFFHFVTENHPGIWATVTTLLADNNINIESVQQKWLDPSRPSNLFVLVDPVKEGQARRAFEMVVSSEGIFSDSNFYRII
jgi:homoserine dehydrogenase